MYCPIRPIRGIRHPLTTAPVGRTNCSRRDEARIEMNLAIKVQSALGMTTAYPFGIRVSSFKGSTPENRDNPAVVAPPLTVRNTPPSSHHDRLGFGLRSRFGGRVGPSSGALRPPVSGANRGRGTA